MNAIPALTQTGNGWLLRWGGLEQAYTEAELSRLLSPGERKLLVSGTANPDQALGASLILRRIFGERARLIPAPSESSSEESPA